jgi:hypothetical protein
MHRAVGEDRIRPAGVEAVDLSVIRAVDGTRPLFPRSPAPGAGGSGSGGAFHIFTVPSRLPEAIHLPSGLKDTAMTQLV